MDNNYVKFSEVLEYIRYGLENDLLVYETTSHFGKQDNFFYDYIRRGGATALSKGSITQEQYSELLDLYERLKLNAGKPKNLKQNGCTVEDGAPDVIESKVCLEEEPDEDSETYGIAKRDENNKITHYEFAIRGRHKELLRGTISREIMNEIFLLYTKESGNLTQRTVARELLNELNLDFFGFQRILKVFGITKASIPVAFHVLEEESTNAILEKVFREKEKNFFLKLEQTKYKKLEENNLRLLEENKNLKGYIKNTQNLLSRVDFSKITPFQVEEQPLVTDKAMCLFIADAHFGALVNQDESLYDNDYTIEEVQRRFVTIIEKVCEISASLSGLDRLMIFNLGDFLDGDNNKTSRGGHFLPQYLTGKQQFNFGVTLMQQFVETLYQRKVAYKIDYYSVATSNHDGTLGYAASRLLVEYFKVKYPGMIATVSEKFIDWVKYGEHIIMYAHGKDQQFMTRNYPLVIDNGLEIKINEFIDYHLPNIAPSSNILFVKADLHTSATTYGKKFKYRSVGSIFGSSLHSQLNYGNATPVCEYTIIDKKDKSFQQDGRIILVK